MSISLNSASDVEAFTSLSDGSYKLTASMENGQSVIAPFQVVGGQFVAQGKAPQTLAAFKEVLALAVAGGAKIVIQAAEGAGTAVAAGNLVTVGLVAGAAALVYFLTRKTKNPRKRRR